MRTQLAILSILLAYCIGGCHSETDNPEKKPPVRVFRGEVLKISNVAEYDKDEEALALTGKPIQACTNPKVVVQIVNLVVGHSRKEKAAGNEWVAYAVDDPKALFGDEQDKIVGKQYKFEEYKTTGDAGNVKILLKITPNK